jgi:4,5-DOPA dioxygenase extradiol
MGAIGLSMSDLFALNSKEQDELMPVLFIGHGNPMNAIEENEFSKKWRAIGQSIPRPTAILCISAHWLSNGTRIMKSAKPKTIHDFGGFPDALFKAQYPAPGAPLLAEDTIKLMANTKVVEDFEQGFDHGCWSVLKPMFPNADIPVYQLSIDVGLPEAKHFEIATQLQTLRKRGVLIIGSGNIVHHLGMIQWKDTAFDWALEFDQKIKQAVLDSRTQDIINYKKMGKAAELSVPGNDHYLPLIYALGAGGKTKKIEVFNEKVTLGSISMTSYILY